MDNQKVVVILLVITIILSILSVALTVGLVGDGSAVQKRSVVDDPDAQAAVAFGIQTSPTSTTSGGTG